MRPHEELANALTAVASLVLAFISLPFLIIPAYLNGGSHAIWAAAIFGGSLVLLHSASALYHSITHSKLKHVCRVIDHSCIYFLIAGTYTPVALVSLRHGGGDRLFAAIWSLALLGVVCEILFFHHLKRVRMFHYFLMGWLGLFSAHALFYSVPARGLALLVLGSLVYSIGVIFFAWKRLPYHHAVWHVFVLVGGLCHFLAVAIYVVPTAFA